MLSVVIPVYNEAARLADSLRQIAQHLEKLSPGNFEIVCSDDGSRDDSPRLVEEAARDWPVQLVRSEVNQGKGAAVTRGMLVATGDPVFFFDADLSTPLTEMEGFLEVLQNGADVVIGTRKHPDAIIQLYQPWYRVQLGLAYTRVVNTLTGLRFSDYTCGFKAFRRQAAQETFSRSRLAGWSFDAEILFLASRLGYRVAEVPVHWADCPDSRVRLFRAIVASFLELLSIRYHHLRGTYRIKRRAGG